MLNFIPGFLGRDCAKKKKNNNNNKMSSDMRSIQTVLDLNSKKLREKRLTTNDFQFSSVQLQHVSHSLVIKIIMAALPRS